METENKEEERCNKLDRRERSCFSILTTKKHIHLNEKNISTYTDLESIKKEVQDSKNLFKKYNWPTIDVTRKSVEETAASIIKIHEIYLNNVK